MNIAQNVASFPTDRSLAVPHAEAASVKLAMRSLGGGVSVTRQAAVTTGPGRP